MKTESTDFNYFIVYTSKSNKSNKSFLIHEIAGDIEYLPRKNEFEMVSNLKAGAIPHIKSLRDNPIKFTGTIHDLTAHSIYRQRAVIPINSGGEMVDIEGGDYTETLKGYNKRLKDSLYSILFKD